MSCSTTESARRWATCLGSVLVLHGAALAWMVRGEQAQGVAQVKAGQAVSVRLLSSAPVVSAPEPEAQALTPSPSAGGTTDVTQGGAPDSDSTMDMDGYVPRRWLSVAPQPTAPVLLPFPSAFQDRARYKAVLNLFIEADGRVGRVEFVGIALPEVLERAARNTFEHARFTPGQVKGRIVKSLIQIEVDFDGLGSG